MSPIKTIVTGNVIDHGKFSSIIELKIQDSRKRVAGKVFKIDPSDIQHFEKKTEVIVKEVNTILKFSHDNIVLSEGVTFLPDRILPVHLMEVMTSSLQKYLVNNPNVPKQIKLSILQNTVSGLHYLHNLSPPFTHGHLNAENVLVDATVDAYPRARIGGFDITDMVEQVTQYEEYKPPEAQGGTTPNPEPSLDVFSFGHLCLVTIFQRELKELPPPQYSDNEGEQRIRYEAERRGKLLKKVNKVMPEELEGVIKECLCNNSDHRPKAGYILEKLQGKCNIYYYEEIANKLFLIRFPSHQKSRHCCSDNSRDHSRPATRLPLGGSWVQSPHPSRSHQKGEGESDTVYPGQPQWELPAPR